MDEVCKKRLETAGVDVRGSIERFAGNEGLYVKFLMKFLQDTTFQSLSQAMEKGDLDEALRASHTLKGLSGNLGLTPLFDACSEFVTAIRKEQPGRCPALYEDICRCYGDITKVIKKSEG